MKEAKRRKNLQPEMVSWHILTEDDFDFDGEILYEEFEVSDVSGMVDVGRVLVINEFAAAWTMTAQEFDQRYQGV